MERPKAASGKKNSPLSSWKSFLALIENFYMRNKISISISVADLGFPRGGGANPRVGVLTYYIVRVFPKTA